MSYAGDYSPGKSIDIYFNTHTPDGTPTTFGGTPAISVYKGNSTTETTLGVTLDVDFDSRTGLNHVRIDTSADATFYASAFDYTAIITAGTVGGVSVVGCPVGSFSLNNRSALRPSTAGNALNVSGTGEADANVVKINNATFTLGGTVNANVIQWNNVNINNPEPPTANAVADAVLTRDVANVEVAMPEHCMGTIVLACLEWDTTSSPNSLTIFRSNHSDVHKVKALTTVAGADSITGVN